MSVSVSHVTWGNEMKSLPVILSLLLLSAAVPAFAAEAPTAGAVASPVESATPAVATTPAAATTTAAAIPPEAEDETPGTTEGDTFIPTVEISEDLSVSFPADI
jgi:hypothetical protein